MNILLIIGIVLLNLIIHELAHALAMMRNGIAIEEIGIGFPIRFIPLKLNLYLTKQCEITFKGKKYCFNLILSPFLLGAYVKPANEKEIEALSYRQKASIFGAGIIANLILGFMLLIPLTVVSQLTAPIAVNIAKIVLVSLLSIISIGLLVKWGKQFSAIMPLFSIILMVFIGWSLIKFGVGKTLVSPVGIVAIASGTKSISQILLFGFAISFGFGMTNMLPLSILDGGQTFLALLEKWFGKKKWLKDAFNAVGMVLFLSLIITAIVSDIINFKNLKVLFKSIKK